MQIVRPGSRKQIRADMLYITTHFLYGRYDNQEAFDLVDESDKTPIDDTKRQEKAAFSFHNNR